MKAITAFAVAVVIFSICAWLSSCAAGPRFPRPKSPIIINPHPTMRRARR
jgi:hypothetical protein